MAESLISLALQCREKASCFEVGAENGEPGLGGGWLMAGVEESCSVAGMSAIWRLS